MSIQTQDIGPKGDEKRISKREGILWFLVGLASWLTINSLFAEMVLLIKHLPEGWKLYSYLTIIIQFGNIGPIVAGVLGPKYYSHISIVIVLIGICSMTGMACLWESVWLGHSVFLFLFTFTASFADCTSSVTFWTLSSYADPGVVVWLSGGESSTSLIANILSLSQNPGADEPRFSPFWFFMANAAILAISLWAFLRLQPGNKRLSRMHSIQESGYVEIGNNPGESWRRFEYLTPLVCMGVLNFLSNGVGSAIGGYATLPYGYLLSQYDGNIKGFLIPVAAFLPLLIGCTVLWPSFFMAVGINTMTVYWALLSPDPPGVGTNWSLLVVCIDVFGAFCLTYAKCALTIQYRNSFPDRESFMRHLGFSMQVGSFLGATTGFLLVVVLDLFKQA